MRTHLIYDLNLNAGGEQSIDATQALSNENGEELAKEFSRADAHQET